MTYCSPWISNKKFIFKTECLPELTPGYSWQTIVISCPCFLSHLVWYLLWNIVHKRIIFFVGEKYNWPELHHHLGILSINSLAPRRYDHNLKLAIFNFISRIGNLSISHEIAEVNTRRPQWWSVNIGSGNGLVQLGNKLLPSSQCWPRSMSPYGITRPQQVKLLAPREYDCDFKYMLF